MPHGHTLLKRLLCEDAVRIRREPEGEILCFHDRNISLQVRLGNGRQELSTQFKAIMPSSRRRASPPLSETGQKRPKPGSQAHAAFDKCRTFSTNAAPSA